MRVIPATATAAMLLAAGCSSGGHGVSAACAKATQEANQLLAQASASASAAANPLVRLSARDSYRQAVSRNQTLAAYIVVQHASCFSDTAVAAAQLRIDQNKAQQ